MENTEEALVLLGRLQSLYNWIGSGSADFSCAESKAAVIEAVHKTAQEIGNWKLNMQSSLPPKTTAILDRFYTFAHWLEHELDWSNGISRGEAIEAAEALDVEIEKWIRVSLRPPKA